jgi:hypothetical protein
MTGQFDPNGSLHAYHLERQRREMWRSIGLGLVCFAVLCAGVVLMFIALSLAGR